MGIVGDRAHLALVHAAHALGAAWGHRQPHRRRPSDEAQQRPQRAQVPAPEPPRVAARRYDARKDGEAQQTEAEVGPVGARYGAEAELKGRQRPVQPSALRHEVRVAPPGDGVAPQCDCPLRRRQTDPCERARQQGNGIHQVGCREPDSVRQRQLIRRPVGRRQEHRHQQRRQRVELDSAPLRRRRRLPSAYAKEPLAEIDGRSHRTDPAAEHAPEQKCEHRHRHRIPEQGSDDPAQRHHRRESEKRIREQKEIDRNRGFQRIGREREQQHEPGEEKQLRGPPQPPQPLIHALP